MLAAFESNPDMTRQGEVATLADAENYVRRLIAPDSPREAWVVAPGDVVAGLAGITVDEENKSGGVWYWIAVNTRGLERLELGHRVNNPASRAVALHAGFVKEGTERGKFLIEGHRIDVDTYGRLRTDPAPEFEPIPMRACRAR